MASCAPFVAWRPPRAFAERCHGANELWRPYGCVAWRAGVVGAGLAWAGVRRLTPMARLGAETFSVSSDFVASSRSSCPSLPGQFVANKGVVVYCRDGRLDHCQDIHAGERPPAFSAARVALLYMTQKAREMFRSHPAPHCLAANGPPSDNTAAGAGLSRQLSAISVAISTPPSLG